MVLNKDCLEKYLKKKPNSDFDLEKVKKSLTTFQFDNEYTLKLLAQEMTHQEYYKELSCLDYIDSIDNPIFFIHSKNDPICR